jgi:hypothetical protein
MFSKERIAQVSCGGHHTVFLDTNGKIYTCGNNSYGQTGHRSTQNVSVPQMVYNVSNKRIEQIACGWNHTLIFVAPYYVYATGLSKYGELGLRDFEMRKGFTLIEGLAGKNLVQIFAGGYHSWFLFDHEQPDLDYEPPSPLLTTPVHSINEEEPSKRRPRSNDSNNPRRKKLTLEEKIPTLERRNINIRSDDDFKKFEEILKGPRFGFDPETKSANMDTQNAKKKTFDIFTLPNQGQGKARTPGVTSPFNEEAILGRKTGDMLPHSSSSKKLAIQDNYGKKQLPMTPRSKFHQQVDQDPEIVIPGYQAISSDEDRPSQKSSQRHNNKFNTGPGGNYHKNNFGNPDIAHEELSEEEEVPPSINESEHTPSQNSYDQFENDEYEEQEEEEDQNNYQEESEEEEEISDQGHRQHYEKPPTQNIYIKQPKFYTENDDISDSHDNSRRYRDIQQNEPHRRKTDNVPMTKPGRRLEPKLTEDFGSDGELIVKENSGNSEDEYAKLSRKMNNMINKNKSDTSMRDERGKKPDDKELFKKQKGKPPALESSSEENNNNFERDRTGKQTQKEENQREDRGRSGRVGGDAQLPSKTGQGEEFRGSFSQKPSKSDNFYDEYDQKRKSNKPKRKSPPRIKEKSEEEDEKDSLQEYLLAKNQKPQATPSLQNKSKTNGNKIPKNFDSYEREAQQIQRFESSDDEGGYHRHGEEFRGQRNIFKNDFHLLFVDLKYIHRFAILFCEENDNDALKRIVNKTIEDLKNKDPQVNVVNFLESEEFYEKGKDGFLTSLRLDRIKGVNSHILMMIALPENYEQITSQKRIPRTNYDEFESTNTALGPMYQMSEGQIIEDLRLKTLATWYLSLKVNLAGKLTNAKFYELRPATFR